MSPLLVSIIIPCYNSEQYVAEAIQSALDQTYTNCEIIVIDDGSTDGSLEVIKGFGHRIRWETGPNQGGCAARNRGLELSKGEWIQFLDSDDLLPPEKIHAQMTSLSGKDAWTMAVSDWYPMHSNVEKSQFPVVEQVSLLKATSGLEFLAEMWRTSTVCILHGWLLSKKLIGVSGMWDNSCIVDQDGDFFGRALCIAKEVIYTPGISVPYRIGDTPSVSKRSCFLDNQCRMAIWHGLATTLSECLGDKASRLSILRQFRKLFIFHLRKHPELFTQCLRHEWRYWKFDVNQKSTFRIRWIYASLGYCLTEAVLNLFWRSMPWRRGAKRD